MAKFATVDQSTHALVCGTFTAADTAAHQMFTASTVCKRVFLCAPVDASGAPTNTQPVFFGNATLQNDWIAPDGSRDRMVHIDDPSKLFVKLGQAGEHLEYRIEY